MPFLARVLAAVCGASMLPAALAADVCRIRSGPDRTPVVELYTSEGCSSCPPADRMLSTLKAPAAGGQVVAEAFHVAYWDHLGWVDRFAAPSHTNRQREWARRHGSQTIYTPQLVRDDRPWQVDGDAWNPGPRQPARVSIELLRPNAESVEATVVPQPGVRTWSAYWTVTEHGHRSKVTAGENAGEVLHHDFVVRQYVPVGRYSGTQKLKLRPVPETPGHPRQVNLVVFDAADGKPLQALSLGC